MKSSELREKFLNFFENKGHKILPSSSLLPQDDPSVLFTSAGMQQFKKLFAGYETPKYPRVATAQKCIRTSDIEEVGDDTHVTFLEMLGNFSFGDPASSADAYFKKEAIKWGLEFLIKETKLDRQKITTTIFKGDKQVPRDQESYEILKNLGFKDNEIKECGREDNFWGPTGSEGPCGSTVEFYYNGVEIWNLVFNEYFQTSDKKLKLLDHKGVDTGMGLERILAAVNGKKSVYETDLFEPLAGIMSQESKIEKIKSIRIIIDHIKAAVFLIADGVILSNVEQGYVLRRLIRRSVRHANILGIKKEENLSEKLAKKVIEIYKNIYPELEKNENKILEELQKEENKFEKTLARGLKKFETLSDTAISGVDVFHLYDTYGFPLELTKELAQEKNIKIDESGFWQEFKKHQQISRAGIEKKFKGGLVEQNLEARKLHTATHLLHQALRQVLGSHVKQMGSNITSERLRFDFANPRKMTQEEIKKVEDIVNQKIAEKLEVKCEEMPYKKAMEEGALAFFHEKYPEIIKVYTIGNPSTGSGQVFSKEVCAGPHVKNTSELGHFKIKKEESSSAGVRRIKAILT